MHSTTTQTAGRSSWQSTLLTLNLIGVLLLTGCGTTQRTEPAKPLTLTGLDKQQAVAASEEVLRKMHFSIEKSDAEAGVVRTMPLSGSQFFEVWAKDNAGSFNKAEANVQSLRRTAEVTVQQSDGNIEIACETAVQRLSVPEEPVTSSARAYSMFSKSTGSLQRLQLTAGQQQQMQWVDLGPDYALADAILQRIEKQIAHGQKEQSR